MNIASKVMSWYPLAKLYDFLDYLIKERILPL